MKAREKLATQSAFSPDGRFGIQLSPVGEQKEETVPDEKAVEIEPLTPKELVRYAIERVVYALVPQLGVARKFSKIVWLVIYLGLMGVFLYSFEKMVEKYLDYPTTNQLMIETEANLTFPAVTVCNENPVRKSMIGRYRKFRDLVILDDYVAMNAHLKIQGYGETNEPDTVCPKGKCLESFPIGLKICALFMLLHTAHVQCTVADQFNFDQDMSHYQITIRNMGRKFYTAKTILMEWILE